MDNKDPYKPRLVPDEHLDAYEEDLDFWKEMVTSTGTLLTWRDEQNFKRAWVIQQERIDALTPVDTP